MLNGIIVLNKPRGVTSSDCVYKLRKLLKIKKIGHAGTLDPEVNGVLPIAVGQATKLIEKMHEKDKKYIGVGLLGFATDSYDVTGKKIAEKKIITPFSDEEIQSGMKKLVGDISQMPPIYSAVKVNGKRLYEYARENIEVQRPMRDVTVKSYNVVNTSTYDCEKQQQTFDFSVTCSKGTYVRSLVNDLGAILDVPAVMVKLTRIASSGYNITDAVTLEDISRQIDQPHFWLQPIDSFFDNVEHFVLNSEQYDQVRNGAALKINASSNEVALVYSGKIKAIYEKKLNVYKPQLMLLQND
ncbi:tRNA pseudouridine(55) synthase TruB [Lactobacillus iners]|uniref:tRNA pseudouridine(55) synthase TruB n=1 Tax=Lactobacillus iners TaxID=147802 RepID=UPI001F098CF1|nr:tRNA pseudouridine(55) synthase TruB [Lactobacillus iners]